MKNTPRTKAVIYARVSSKEQEETGYSLEAQEKLLKDYAYQKDFDLVKVYKVTESASGKQIRKTFIDMLEYVEKNKINVILCEKIDRLTRNLKDAAIANDWIQDSMNKEIHFVKENFIVSKNTRAHENLVWDMKVAIARFYTNNLSEEVRKGQNEKIFSGWLPTTPPIGYKTIGEKGHKIHVVDKDIAPYIKEMFSLYATGNYSTVALVSKMFDLGLRSRAGATVVKSQIHKILSEPFYYGKFRWKGNLYPGKHEPIITMELFDQVKLKMTRGSAPYHNRGMTELRGKVLCGSCNKTITWELQKGTLYGGCKQCKAQIGKENKYIHKDDVEQHLLAVITSVAPRNDKVLDILSQALKESHSEEIQLHDTQVKNINSQLERIKQRMRVMYDDKLDQRITADFYDEKVQRFEEEKEVLLNSLKNLEADNTEYYRVGFAVHELALRSNEIYLSKDATIEERRLLLSYAFSNISILRGEIKTEYTKAFNFLMEWMPKVNSILELQKTLVNKGKESTFVPSQPIVLRG